LSKIRSEKKEGRPQEEVPQANRSVRSGKSGVNFQNRLMNRKTPSSSDREEKRTKREKKIERAPAVKNMGSRSS